MKFFFRQGLGAFVWVHFHLINPSATWFRFAFLAYKLPYRKFYEEHFLSQKVFSGPNRTWDIGKELILGGGQEHATVHGAAQLRGGNFQKLFQTPTLKHFLKILLSPKYVFLMFLVFSGPPKSVNKMCKPSDCSRTNVTDYLDIQKRRQIVYTAR